MSLYYFLNQLFLSMNGGHLSSKSRNNIKSPQTHNNHPSSDETKQYKKKYQEAREQLKQEKRMVEQLTKQNCYLESRVHEQQVALQRQQRQLQKKEEINDVLMERLKCLKKALAEGQRKGKDDSSYDDRNYTKSNKSSTSEECSGKNQVGGYFGSIFK